MTSDDDDSLASIWCGSTPLYEQSMIPSKSDNILNIPRSLLPVSHASLPIQPLFTRTFPIGIFPPPQTFDIDTDELHAASNDPSPAQRQNNRTRPHSRNRRVAGREKHSELTEEQRSVQTRKTEIHCTWSKCPTSRSGIRVRARLARAAAPGRSHESRNLECHD